MELTRPGFSNAMGILDGLEEPTGGKFGAEKAHRMVLVPPDERGLVSIAGPVEFCYSNTVGAFGAVSDGRNWDLLTIAACRRALSLVDKKSSPYFCSMATLYVWQKAGSLTEVPTGGYSF